MVIFDRSSVENNFTYTFLCSKVFDKKEKGSFITLI